MKHFSIAILSLTMFFVACDDSSSSPTDELVVKSDSSEEIASSSEGSTSSSSAKQDNPVSSSSEKKANDNEASSSSEMEKGPESSSDKTVESSSSETEKGPESSSDKTVESSSSETEKKLESSSNQDISSSSENATESSSSANNIESSSNKGGFDWSIPKEDYLSPEIEYDSIKDSRDGKVYKTVKIGEQVWMAENLNYSDSAETPSLKTRMWCYNDQPKNCDVGGAFYTWSAAIDSIALYNGGKGVICGYDKKCDLPAKVQGICPDGWHLPDSTEWSALFKEVGGSSTAGTPLKSQKGWDIIKASSSNGNGTDTYGFAAIPVGLIEHEAKYTWHSPRYNGMLAYFWVATEGSAKTAFTAQFENANRYTWLHYTAKDMGISIRCVKDANKP